jgi:hypothetical protein
MIARNRVVQHRQAEALLSLEEPVQITSSVACKLFLTEALGLNGLNGATRLNDLND